MSPRLFWLLPYPIHWLVEKLTGWRVLAWTTSRDVEYHWNRVDD